MMFLKYESFLLVKNGRANLGVVVIKIDKPAKRDYLYGKKSDTNDFCKRT